MTFMITKWLHWSGRKIVLSHVSSMARDTVRIRVRGLSMSLFPVGTAAYQRLPAGPIPRCYNYISGQATVGLPNPSVMYSLMN